MRGYNSEELPEFRANGQNPRVQSKTVREFKIDDSKKKRNHEQIRVLAFYFAFMAAL